MVNNLKTLNDVWEELKKNTLLIASILGGLLLLKYAVHSILPTYHIDTLLLLAFLIGFLIVLLNKLKSGMLVFFLASLLALILFDKSLFDYAKWLYGQARSATVFMIILFGGALILISRTDLLEKLKSEKARGLSRDNLQPLQNEIDTFCLLRRIDKYVQRRFQSNIKTNHIFKFFLTAIPVAANFVSSAVAVIFFKSLWAPGVSNFITDEKNRRRAAGILCLCVSGCLVLYTSDGIKSVWWLFFKEMVALESLMPKYPIAVYLYALLSYLHGYILIFCGQDIKTEQEGEPFKSYKPLLYLMILAVCILAIIVSSAVIALQDNATLDKTSSPVGLARSADAPADPAKSDQEKQDSEETKLTVCAVFLGVIMAFLIAQILMYRCYSDSFDPSWTAASYGNLLLQGMSRVFGTVLALIVILAFKDIISDALPDSADFGAGDQIWQWQVGVTIAAIGLIVATGPWIGSSFGMFAIGYTVFSIAGVTDPKYHRTVVELLILLAAFYNQRSPQADNVQMMLGSDCGPKDVAKVWSVRSFSKLEWIKAQNVQVAILVFSISLGAILRFIWPQVF